MDPAIRACWQSYLDTLDETHPHRSATPDAFGFGDTDELIDELAALVVAGTKRATTSLPSEYTALAEPLPKVGDLSIVLRAGGVPVAIIERTDVQQLAFGEVDAAFAAHEGEGDGSLAFWRAAHRDYFAGVRRLGGELSDDTMVICQKFRVVFLCAARAAGRSVDV